jgi:glycerol-3-phosphate acyltransferase PlsY
MKHRKQFYWCAVAIEIAGTIAILWHGIPIYRRFLTGTADQPADIGVVVWAAAAAAAIQLAYWGATRIFSSIELPRSIVASHFVLFAARLNFVFAGALLSVIVFARLDQIEFSLWRFALLLAVLFSLFCSTLEFERLGRRLGER